jgi:transposase
VRMYAEVRGDYRTETAALQSVVEKLDIGSRETLRNWVKQQEVDAGQRPGTTTEESAQLKALKKENAELKRANEILKAAASFFAAGLDRPHTRS